MKGLCGSDYVPNECCKCPKQKHCEEIYKKYLEGLEEEANKETQGRRKARR